jgi:uncharacterized protein YidB (DUF937 family)
MESEVGLLDDVIGAALGGRSQGALSSPIATALMALLASSLKGGGQQGQGGGLDALVEQFRQSGLEQVINSWIGTGPNQRISPTQLHQALGQERVEDLSEQTGLSRDDLLGQLSQILPGVVDNLTPHGQLPKEADLLPGPR